ncbi:hypothetical protein FQZ97_478110 [compost metagenome]
MISATSANSFFADYIVILSVTSKKIDQMTYIRKTPIKLLQCVESNRCVLKGAADWPWARA